MYYQLTKTLNKRCGWIAIWNRFTRSPSPIVNAGIGPSCKLLYCFFYYIFLSPTMRISLWRTWMPCYKDKKQEPVRPCLARMQYGLCGAFHGIKYRLANPFQGAYCFYPAGSESFWYVGDPMFAVCLGTLPTSIACSRT
jgi:hypothetical protein